MEYLEHITKDGERWDAISWQYYGDPHRYEEIIRANPDVPVTPILRSGLVLRIPLIEMDQLVSPDDLPPWKR